MSLTAAVVSELMRAGLKDQALLDACARIEAAAPVCGEPQKTKRQERNHRYYVSKRLKPSYSDVSDANSDAPAAPKDVEPNLLTVENNQTPTTPLKPPAARRFDDWPDDFGEQLWAVYPRKTEKKAGMDALARLHRQDRVSWGDLMRGVRPLDDCDPQFVPALARWLKGERWKDERPAQGRAPPHRQASNRRSLIDALHRAIPDDPAPEPTAFLRIAG